MKIVVTEAQMKNVKKLIKEQREASPYRLECDLSCDVAMEYSDLVYKGNVVEDVSQPADIRVQYIVDMDVRKYGVKDVTIFNFRGPAEVSFEITHDSKPEPISLPLNWEKAQAQSDNSLGHIGIDRMITLSLKNDESGNIFVEKILITKFAL
jgi:hypothetical protein